MKGDPPMQLLVLANLYEEPADRARGGVSMDELHRRVERDLAKWRVEHP